MKHIKYFEAKQKEESLSKFHENDPSFEIKTIDENRVKIDKELLSRIKKSLNRSIKKEENFHFIVNFNGPYEVHFFIFHSQYDPIDEVLFNKRALMKFRLKVYSDDWFVFQKVSLSEKFVGRKYIIDGWDGLQQKFKKEVKLAKKTFDKPDEDN